MNGTPWRVVVADRDVDQRHLLRRALAGDPGFDVVADSGDGREAVRLVSDCEADVLLLDLDLPGLDGLGVVERVASQRPACRCVLVSSAPASELPRSVPALSRATPPARLAEELRSLLATAEPSAAGVLRVEVDNLAPRAARRFVAALLADLDRAVVEVVELLVTEVVTNAVLHARSPAEVVVRRVPGAVRVEVFDDDDSFPVRRRPGHDQPGGRGFELVEQLSRAWGIDMQDIGKRVWFEVPT